MVRNLLLVAAVAMCSGCLSLDAPQDFFVNSGTGIKNWWTGKTRMQKLDDFEMSAQSEYHPLGVNMSPRMAADADIKMNSSCAKMAGNLLTEVDEELTGYPDPKSVPPGLAQERSNIDRRHASYLAQLKSMCEKAKSQNLVVSIPVGEKFLDSRDSVYDPIRAEPPKPAAAPAASPPVSSSPAAVAAAPAAVTPPPPVKN